MIEKSATPETLAGKAGRAFADYRDGDPSRMADLVQLLTPILWHTVRAQRLDQASAEDVLQSTWLTLIRQQYSIVDPRSILQWLIITAKREAWRISRSQTRTEPTVITDDAIVASDDYAPDLYVLRTDDQRRLWKHIAQLPERCRVLLRVIAFADRPDYSAIAGWLGMPVGSVGPTRGRCLAKLRTLLDQDPEWSSR
jgi:RNA polymerase sigma factor (sigma-70 family)